MASIRANASTTRSSARSIRSSSTASTPPARRSRMPASLEIDEATRFRAGVSIGSGIGGLPGIESESIVLYEKGPGRVSPHFVHGRLINLISGQVSIKYGLMGPNHAVVTACSTGAHSIGDAARMIKDDDADIMLRRRRRGDHLPDRHCRLRPGAGAQHQFQRPAREGQPPLGQGPRRLRHGRGRGRRGARGI